MCLRPRTQSVNQTDSLLARLLGRCPSVRASPRDARRVLVVVVVVVVVFVVCVLVQGHFHTATHGAMERARASFDALASLSDPLRVPASERTYGRQFAQMYDYRLAVLRRRAREAAMAQRPDTCVNATYIERLLDIPPRQMCMVVGTFYSAMQLKPDVLQDIARDLSLPAPPPRTSYVDTEHDELFLEDQSGRVRVVGDLLRPGTQLAQTCVTGVVACVIGIETPDGDFEVHHVFFPGLPPTAAVSYLAAKPAPTPANNHNFIVLASGLYVGESDPLSDLARDLLMEWLSGELCSSTDERARVARISSLVLAGDCVQQAAWKQVSETKSMESNPFAFLDPYIDQLCETLDAVVVMPGMHDPCTVTLPQQPLLRTLLPRASQRTSLHLGTNPTWFSLNGRAILATSGQNLDDLLKYMPDDAKRDSSAALDMAVATLRWSHMAPTAPDTLWCYPFKAADAFVIRAAPDVYVIGNQAAFATTTFQASPTHQVRVILVPTFARTHQVVVLDTETLEPHIMSFHTS